MGLSLKQWILACAGMTKGKGLGAEKAKPNNHHVTPAKAGVHGLVFKTMDSGLRRNDDRGRCGERRRVTEFDGSLLFLLSLLA